MDARYETSIEVSINCKSINEDIWGEMYDLLFNYTNDLPRGKNDLFFNTDNTQVWVSPDKIFVKTLHSFSTDTVIIYRNLMKYRVSDSPLIALGVCNEKGKLLTPFIMDIIVLLKANLPKAILCKGYLHPEDWKESMMRLHDMGYL